MTNNNSLRQEIKKTLDSLMGECEGIAVPEPESTKYINEILKLIEKHGYRKVETMDGYWSD